MRSCYPPTFLVVTLPVCVALTDFDAGRMGRILEPVSCHFLLTLHPAYEREYPGTCPKYWPSSRASPYTGRHLQDSRDLCFGLVNYYNIIFDPESGLWEHPKLKVVGLRANLSLVCWFSAPFGFEFPLCFRGDIK